MPTIKRFEDLEIWRIARNLARKIKLITEVGPLSKDFRFRSQMMAAAGSVMDNIAEGFERGSRLEFINFLSIAKGSCGEIRSQLYRSLDFQYIEKDNAADLIEHYESLASNIAGFMAYLNRTSQRGQKFKERK